MYGWTVVSTRVCCCKTYQKVKFLVLVYVVEVSREVTVALLSDVVAPHLATGTALSSLTLENTSYTVLCHNEAVG